MHKGGDIGNLDVTPGQEDDLLAMCDLAVVVDAVTHLL